MGEKYYSQMEGYEDCFIEVTDKWTVKDMRSLADSEEKDYFELFQKKVEAMFLRDAESVEFTNPREFKAENILDFDVALAGFVGSALPLHVRKRRNLGGINVRQSSPSSGGTTSPTPK